MALPPDFAPQIPPVVPPRTVGSQEEAEQQFLSEPQELDLSLRRWAARGGLIAAAILYGAGLFALYVFLGLKEGIPPVTADKWHIVVTTVVALFTVPTVILLTIIRSSAPSKADPALDGFHVVLGEKVVHLLEKIADKLVSKK